MDVLWTSLGPQMDLQWTFPGRHWDRRPADVLWTSSYVIQMYRWRPVDVQWTSSGRPMTRRPVDIHWTSKGRPMDVIPCDKKTSSGRLILTSYGRWTDVLWTSIGRQSAIWDLRYHPVHVVTASVCGVPSRSALMEASRSPAHTGHVRVWCCGRMVEVGATVIIPCLNHDGQGPVAA